MKLNKMPKITVILTSYNHEKFLREAIDSVLFQTESDFELIIWDDASTDTSWDIIQSYDDPRIKAFRNDRCMRGVWGINKAIFEHATSPYIAIHHSDDTWDRTKLEKQIAFLDTHPEVGAVFTKVAVVKENGMPLKDEKHPYKEVFNVHNRDRFLWLRHFFYHRNCLCHPSVVVRKSVYEEIGGYVYGFSQLGDFNAWIRICMRHQIYILDEALVTFRILDGKKNSSSDTPRNHISCKLEMYQTFKLYRALAGSDDLYLVFPELKAFYSHSAISRLFVLGLLMAKINEHGVLGLIGLEFLSELLQSPQAAQLLLERHNFSYTDYIELAKDCDCFRPVQIVSRYSFIETVWEKCRNQIEAQNKEIARLKRLLHKHQLPFE